AGGLAGVTAVVDVTVTETKVSAIIGNLANEENHTVNNGAIRSGNVLVHADGSNDTFLLGVGAAGGVAAVAGTASVLKFTDTVNSYASGTIEATKTDVVAKSNNKVAISATSIAGGAVGIAPAVTTFIFDGATYATVGYQTNITGSALNVNAVSNENVKASALAAAVGGGAGADSVAAVISDIVTGAMVSDNANFMLDGQIKIGATDTPTFALTTGNAAGGGAAFGAAVDVLVFYNTVYAGIGNNAVIQAGGIDIDADVERNLTLYAAAGSLGGVAASGSVIVVSTGAAVTSGDHNTALSGEGGNTISSLQAKADSSMTNAKLQDNSAHTGTGKASSAIGRANGYIGAVNVSGYFNKANLADQVSAYIGTGGNIKSNSAVSVNAAEKTNICAKAGTIAAGGIAGEFTPANSICQGVFSHFVSLHRIF
ncbi:MAG: hypothetical protein IKC40_08010, partial [Oscillospiraceae bacterium]|nr:hypothetical protein [Oscillospiraceae bacterium]